MKFKKALTVAMASISLMGCTTFATQTVKADKTWTLNGIR